MAERPLSFAMDMPGWEPPEPPSPERCGMGEGALCCKFLLMGPEGIECARFTDLHMTLANRSMTSQFSPEQEDCQAERRSVVAQQQ